MARALNYGSFDRGCVRLQGGATIGGCSLAYETFGALVMPPRVTSYFPPEDSQLEGAGMPNANVTPNHPVWGHFASGSGISPEGVQPTDTRLKELPASEPADACDQRRRN